MIILTKKSKGLGSNNFRWVDHTATLTKRIFGGGGGASPHSIDGGRAPNTTKGANSSQAHAKHVRNQHEAPRDGIRYHIDPVPLYPCTTSELLIKLNLIDLTCTATVAKVFTVVQRIPVTLLVLVAVVQQLTLPKRRALSFYA